MDRCHRDRQRIDVKRFIHGLFATIFLNLRMYKLAERFDPLRDDVSRPFVYLP